MPPAYLVRDRTLEVDAVLSLLLGVVLMLFPRPVIGVLGLPSTDVTFYPALLGGTLVGLGLILVYERFRPSRWPVGIGLAGAGLIKALLAVVLGWWLAYGELGIDLRGRILMWLLVVLLVGLAIVEALFAGRTRKGRETVATP